jgi:hypothetical protein
MFYVGFLFSSTAREAEATWAVERSRFGADIAPPFRLRPSGAPAMAKGQVKSNKEIRKPKAEKPKPAVSVGTSPFTQPPGKK